MILEEDEAFLAHYGVKGMRWGVRKTDREARRDAKEHARAEQYFGKGAGTRRKLIKNAVEYKKKHHPGYAEAFERHLASQNTSKHVEKAIKERKRTDRSLKIKQSLGALARKATGEWGTTAAFTLLASSGFLFLRSDKGRRLTKQTMSKISDFANERRRQRGAEAIQDLLRRQGLG